MFLLHVIYLLFMCVFTPCPSPSGTSPSLSISWILMFANASGNTLYTGPLTVSSASHSRAGSDPNSKNYDAARLAISTRAACVMSRSPAKHHSLGDVSTILVRLLLNISSVPITIASFNTHFNAAVTARAHDWPYRATLVVMSYRCRTDVVPST